MSLVEALRTASDLASRASLANAAGLTFGGKRDLYSALGYPRKLQASDYRSRYKRGDIAARIVEAFPKATWRGGAELIEDEDPEVITLFEEEWGKLNDRLSIWSTFLRADIMAGQGEFSILLIGAPGLLAEEMPTLTSPKQVAYLAAYAPDEVSINTLEDRTDNPRYGLPLTYNLKRASLKKSFERTVHWSRTIHVAEGLLEDRVTGTPRLERVWNRLDDLDKVVGGGSEAFWLRVHKGLIVSLDKDVKIETQEVDKLKEQVEEFVNGMRRTLAARGFEVNDLGSDVAPFNNQVTALMSLISGATEIPQRILLGSERGELASNQDKENWDERVSDRRKDYAEPLVRAFVDRLIEHGALPVPDRYEIRWPEIEDLTDQERADVADKWAGLNAKAKGPVVLAEEIRDRVLGLPKLTPEQIAEWEEKSKPEPPPEIPQGTVAPEEPIQPEGEEEEVEEEEA